MILRRYFQLVLLVIICVFAGVGILTALYMIPTERAEKNVKDSLSLFIPDENMIMNWTGDLTHGAVSNMSDSIMVNTAIFRQFNSPVMNAMLNPEASYENEDDYPSRLVRYVSGEQDYTYWNYSRYWHGYLLFLIPGLQVFKVGELKVLLMFLQLFLLMTVLYELSRINRMYMYFFLIVALFLNPITTVLTFQDSDIYCLMLVFTLLVIRKKDRLIEDNMYMLLFCFNGICVSFFDLLSYPLVAFGIPMITLLLIIDQDWKRKTEILINSAICWSVGYIGMWAGKWIIGSLLTGADIIHNATGTVLYRMSGDLDQFGINNSHLYTLKAQFGSVNDRAMMVLYFISAFLIVYQILKNRNQLKICCKKQLLPFILLMISPFLWYFVIHNHSAMHPWMAYRELAIFVWAFFAAILNMTTSNTSDLKP